MNDVEQLPPQLESQDQSEQLLPPAESQEPGPGPSDVPAATEPVAETPAAPPSNLMKVISEVRLNEITRDACQRIQECRNAMGINYGNGTAQPFSWAWHRQVARDEYAGDHEWRKALGGVFMENNWSLDVAARFVRLLSSKHQNDLIGDDQFMACMPENTEDPAKADLSKQVETKVQKEIGKSNLREVLNEAIRVALTVGESPVKLAYVDDSTVFIGPAVVAVDGNGPIKTPNGSYIFPKDDWIPDATVQGQARLKKDPAYVDKLEAGPGDQPGQIVYRSRLTYKIVEKLEQKLEGKVGLEAATVMTEDLVWDINRPFEQADVIAHCYDDVLANVAAIYNAGFAKSRDGKAILNPRNLAATGDMSQARQPNQQQGEIYHHSNSTIHETINIHETYYKVRVNPGDKFESWLFIVIDYATQMPIYAEYLGNMKMKKPPFAIIRGVESVQGRSYGAGVYKKFADRGLAIDVFFNRLCLKSSKEGSVTFIHEDATQETRAGLDLVIGDKKCYKIPANSEYGKDRPPLFRVNLNEIAEYEMELLEKLIQSGMFEFGVTSSADATAEDMPATQTATGVRNIERTGNLMQRSTENMQADDIEKVLEIAVDTILENMDPVELAYNPAENQLMQLNRDEIRGIPRDVRLLLTKMRSEESMAANTQAAQIVELYYQKPKWLQKIIRPFNLNQLRTLDVPDSDTVLKEPTDQDIAAEQAQMAAQGQPPSESMTIAYKDAGGPPSVVQTKILQKLGMPLSAEELNAIAATPPPTPEPTGSKPKPQPGE